MAETQGASNCHTLPGKSEEIGCFQYLDSTYKLFAKEVLGYIPKRSYINERYVAVIKVNRWLKQGYTAYQIGLIWNGGEPVEKKGVNKHGQEYDSAQYSRRVLSYLE